MSRIDDIRDKPPKLPQKVEGAKQLGEIVHNVRISQRLTQKECAGLCNVGVRFLSDLENGKPTIEFNKVIMVLNGLGIELEAKNRGWNLR